jgi:hypothetical protein
MRRHAGCIVGHPARRRCLALPRRPVRFALASRYAVSGRRYGGGHSESPTPPPARDQPSDPLTRIGVPRAASPEPPTAGPLPLARSPCRGSFPSAKDAASSDGTAGCLYCRVEGKRAASFRSRSWCQLWSQAPSSAELGQGWDGRQEGPSRISGRLSERASGTASQPQGGRTVLSSGVPSGIRTRVLGLKGRRPRPG